MPRRHRRRRVEHDPNKWGKVIVIDGINGSGKSTVAEMLWQRIFDLGEIVELHSDPGDTNIGETIRGLVKNPEVHMTPMTQFMLYSAARAELAHELGEKVRDGIHVVLDRWWPSTFAYQGANGIPFHTIGAVTQAISPEPIAMDRCRTFILDRPLRVALKASRDPASRTGKRGKAYERGRDRFEMREEAFLREVVDRYHALRKMHLASIVKVAEIGSAADVVDYIWDDVQYMFPKGRRKTCRKQKRSQPQSSKQSTKPSTVPPATTKAGSTRSRKSSKS